MMYCLPPQIAINKGWQTIKKIRQLYYKEELFRRIMECQIKPAEILRAMSIIFVFDFFKLQPYQFFPKLDAHRQAS